MFGWWENTGRRSNELGILQPFGVKNLEVFALEFGINCRKFMPEISVDCLVELLRYMFFFITISFPCIFCLEKNLKPASVTWRLWKKMIAN